MDLERFLLNHRISDLLSTFFWVWVLLGLAVFYLFYRLGLARLPHPGVVVRSAGRGILAVLLFVILAPFMAGGGVYHPGRAWDDDPDW